MALRTRCRRGSPIFSMTDLSSSVSSPASSTTTRLRMASARSRTNRGKRANRVRTDTMRTARTLWWSSRAWRSMRVTISWTLTMPSGVSSATACASMVCVVTSSPTRSTRRSTLSTATRMAVASSRSLARRRGDSPVPGMAGSSAGGGMRRKITSTASGAWGACSSRSTPASNSASCSVVSSMKRPRNSSFRALVSGAGGSRGARVDDPRVAVQDLVDVEKHEELVAGAGKAAHASVLHVRASQGGHRLDLRGGQAHDVGDGVHPHAHDLRADHDEDDHGEAAVLDFGKPELHPQIDDRDDGPPKIHDAGDGRRGVGQRRDRRLALDLVHREDGNAVLL